MSLKKKKRKKSNILNFAEVENMFFYEGRDERDQLEPPLCAQIGLPLILVINGAWHQYVINVCGNLARILDNIFFMSS